MSFTMKRRSVLLGSGALMLGACTKVGDSEAGTRFFETVDDWQMGLQRALRARNALAPEYAPEDISPTFRGNGSTDPQNDGYPEHVANGFADWRFTVTGLVERPLSFTLDQIMTLPWVFDWTVALTTLIVSLVLTVGFGLAGTWRILGQKAAPVLRNL